MKLAISGVPGAGKSTLVKLLGEHTTLQVVPEVENVVLAEMGYRDMKHLYEEKGSVGMIENFFLALDRKVKTEQTETHFVCDKSVYDVGARWFGRMWKEATPEQHERVMEVMAQSVKTGLYERVIFLPHHPERVLSGNDARTQDTNVIFQRDLILRGILSRYGVKTEVYEFSFSDKPAKVISDLGLTAYSR